MKKFNELTQFQRDCIIDKFCAEAVVKAMKLDDDEIRKSPVYLEMKGEIGDKPMVPEPIELMHMRLLKIANGDVALMAEIRFNAISKAEKTFYVEEHDETFMLPEVFVCLTR